MFFPLDDSELAQMSREDIEIRMNDLQEEADRLAEYLYDDARWKDKEKLRKWKEAVR